MRKIQENHYYECPSTGVQIAYDARKRRTYIKFRSMCFVMYPKQLRSILYEALLERGSMDTNVMIEAVVSYVVTYWISVGNARGITDKKTNKV